MHLLSTIFPVIAITVIGYLTRRKQIVSEANGAIFEKIAFNFLIPCLLFNGTATVVFPDIIDWRLIGGFYSSILIVYFLGIMAGKFFFSFNNVEYSVFGMGAAYSNVTVIGIPYCLQVFGEDAFLPLFMLISTHNIVLFSLGTIIAEAKKESSTSILRHLILIVKDVVTNPITGSLLAGIVVNLLNIPLHSSILNTLGLVAQAASPMSLFALGGALTRYRITGDIYGTMTIVVLKLLMLPVLVYTFLFHIFEVTPLWAATAVVLASMPIGISPYVFSIKYRACESQIASSIVIATLLSVFTSSFFVLLVT
jgi:predicted permease